MKRIVLLALATVISCTPDPDEDSASVEEQSLTTDLAYADWPKATLMLRSGERPLASRVCAGRVNGIWAGRALGGEADASNMYFCWDGGVYTSVRCTGTPRSNGYLVKQKIAGKGVVRAVQRLEGNVGVEDVLKTDVCLGAGRKIFVSLSQQRLLACNPDGSEAMRFPISSGRKEFPSFMPIPIEDGVAREARPQYVFRIGQRYFVRRMRSPYRGDNYDEVDAFAMRLDFDRATTMEYLHASERCANGCPSPSGPLHGGSHGCINAERTDARRLFLWSGDAASGDTTVVRLLTTDLPNHC